MSKSRILRWGSMFQETIFCRITLVKRASERTYTYTYISQKQFPWYAYLSMPFCTHRTFYRIISNGTLAMLTVAGSITQQMVVIPHVTSTETFNVYSHRLHALSWFHRNKWQKEEHFWCCRYILNSSCPTICHKC